jgi:pyruvate dehydrogenase E2 component (dihydrolipoamide acetyltransferase)
MVHAIRMPKPGQMTEECVLTMWRKQVGDPVSRGDVLFEIETDKSAMEVEAFDDGVLLARLVEEGQTVPVNSVCGYVGEAGEAIPEAEPAMAEEAPTPAAPPDPAPPEPAVAATASVPSSAAPSSVAAARAAAADGGAVRLRISPRASRLAAEAGLDPRAISGTGPGGRIVERDVEVAVAAAASGAAGPMSTVAAAAPVAAPATVAPQISPAEGEDAPRPLSRMRRVIADRLTASWQSTPHFTVTVAVDVTRLLALRADLKAAGTNLTVTDFILAATAQTLVEFPDVNSRTDGVSVFPRRRVHLGVAVSVPAGLVVPVIRDADRSSVADIHDRAAALAAAAREGTLPVDDMTGSTFTVSNLGMFGVEEFSAIINPGEAAILAVSSATRMPVALHDGIAVRSIMRLTLSADHRLVDGEMGARFLNALRRRLEDDTSLRADILNG